MVEAPYLHGTFCWADLSTPDPAAAKSFYGTLFGWAFTDGEPGGGGAYTVCTLDGGAVSGLYALTAEQRDEGWPPSWSTYIAVDSVDRTTADIRAAGGQVLIEPLDIPQTGRMAVAIDPQGAAFCLWQRDSAQPGYSRLGLRPGVVCWNELATRDTQAAGAFYRQLFGWETRTSLAGDLPYVEFLRDGGPLAGMLPLSAIGDCAPPHWLIYFAVADCDLACETAAERGGTVLRGPFDVPDVGRIAVLKDSHGAVFATIALSAAAS
jgi:predicted enzyme related to lactoylglutathione lyase